MASSQLPPGALGNREGLHEFTSFNELDLSITGKTEHDKLTIINRKGCERIG